MKSLKKRPDTVCVSTLSGSVSCVSGLQSLKKGDIVAQPGCFRLRYTGVELNGQYRLQLQDNNGGWLPPYYDYIFSLCDLVDLGFQYVGNDIDQLELF